MIFTADPALDDAPVWRMLAATTGFEIVGVRSRSGDPRHPIAIVGFAGIVRYDTELLRLRVGSLVSAGELAGLLSAWGADFGVVLEGAAPPECVLNAPRVDTYSVSHGWVGPRGGPTSADAVAAEIRSATARRAGRDRRVDVARAPTYRDDTLGDLERRGEELSCALLRATLLRAGEGALPPVAEDVEIQPWPVGGGRARIAAVRQLQRAWRRATNPAWLVKSSLAVVLLAVVAPIRYAWRSARRRHTVRVFTFHRVTELCRDGMSVRPSVFRRQVATICRTHCVVGVDEAIALIRAGKGLARPVAVFTFDDAYLSVKTAAAPVLSRAGVTGCCFVSTQMVGTGQRFAHDDTNPVRGLLEVMGWGDLDALHRAGWLIGGHTMTHARLSQCDSKMLERELAEPLSVLRQRYAPDAVPFAFPFGGNADITPYGRHLVRVFGYSACLSDHGGENAPVATDPFSMRRIEIGGDHSALAWRVKVQGMDLAAWRPRWLRTSRDQRVAHAA